ncbi:MAG: family 10 glycosylhydrolase [Pirellulales bacterium]|nr:family 10 glycosylhydrolase [Pirellulales bacterium]
MKKSWRTLPRRSFLTAMIAGCGGVLAGRAPGTSSDDREVQLSPEHRSAVGRRRRIVVQYDCHGQMGLDIDRWIKYRFSYADQPGTQIDALWWDLGRLGNVVYPSKLLNSFENHKGFKKWRDQGIELVGRLVEETRRRNLECFWHHRVSEVDLGRDGTGAAWKDPPDPLKQAHPDWALKCWWPHGLWDFSNSAVRQITVESLREVAERYDFDGIQLDFARHVPCLPLGRQWELRHHVTDLVRNVRRMLLEVEGKRGRPFLLAAKVPQNLQGCRTDGFDVEVWAAENLVDIFTLGSRSMEVDLGAFRRLTAGRAIRLQPCFDDHHTTDGYRFAPIEVLRGVFANWWQQGADSVCTFNWSNAPPEIQRKFEDDYLPGPHSHEQAYQEIGSAETLQFKDKVFAVERRGGYPWAEGYFNRNDDAPLPVNLSRGGPPGTLRLRISDDLPKHADRVRKVLLRTVWFGANDDEAVEAALNGVSLPVLESDPHWKDAQIFSPAAQPASGGTGQYTVNPSQRLLRLDFAVAPRACRQGENLVQLRLAGRDKQAAGQAALEKLEVHVQYRG